MRDRCALASRRLPVADQRVAAEEGVVEGGGVAGRVDVGELAAPARVGWDAVGREACVRGPAELRRDADRDEHVVGGDPPAILERDLLDAV